VRVEGREIELRSSTLRGVYGEIAVLRILSQDVSLHRLDLLGFEPEVARDFRRMLGGRQGMILIAGPTGSGKTTTLYAALNHLNRDDINILTVEDPVEIKLPGINQIQVHDKAGAPSRARCGRCCARIPTSSWWARSGTWRRPTSPVARR
jgi:type II secretory ATPase GspE/PulE/Tfp pilus assembly ATPase PilB-like protein